MKTWNLYLFKRIASMTCVTLVGIFILYSLFDISTHLSDFYSNSGFKFVETLTYYGCCLIKEQEMFISLAFLLASLFTALSLTTSKQIIALQAASIPLRRAYMPMIVLGICMASTLLLSQQFIAPKAVGWVKQFKLDPLKVSSSKLHLCQIGSTRLFFSSYNKEKRLLEDCIWVFDQHKILRCKELEITGKEAIVHYGHLVEWDEVSKQYIQQSISHSKITPYYITEEALAYHPKSPEEMSLTELVKISSQNTKVTNRAKSLLLHHISLSFFPLFLCMIWIPVCTSYSRMFSSLKVILYSLLSLIILFSFWSVLQILGENSVLNPWIGFSACFGILGFLALTQWKKIT